jgi:hypothetical protein
MNYKTLAIAASLLFTGAAWPQSPVQSCNATAKPPFCSAVSGDRAQGWLTQHRSEVMARNGVVATSQSLAAQAGLDILKKGGNAIDAAVATAAVLSVVEPMNVGPAGDLFAIIYVAKENKLYSLNASGKAPSGATVARMKKLGYVWDEKNWGPGSGISPTTAPQGMRTCRGGTRWVVTSSSRRSMPIPGRGLAGFSATSRSLNVTPADAPPWSS